MTTINAKQRLVAAHLSPEKVKELIHTYTVVNEDLQRGRVPEKHRPNKRKILEDIKRELKEAGVEGWGGKAPATPAADKSEAAGMYQATYDAFSYLSVCLMALQKAGENMQHIDEQHMRDWTAFKKSHDAFFANNKGHFNVDEAKKVRHAQIQRYKHLVS